MKQFYNMRYQRFLKAIVPLIALFLLISLQVNAQLVTNEDCKFVGNIVANTVPPSFNTYWNQVTPENSGKWESVEGTRNSMSWTTLDRAYNHAISNGFPFKHHTFVWGNQQPNWIGTLSKEEQKEEVEEWIRLYSERYPKTAFVDVVNEPLHAVPNYMQALGGAGESGYDWIVWSFEKAREYLPDAKLLINDYGILNDNNSTNNYLKIIKVLQQKNLIDGIGVQGHGYETFDVAYLKGNLDKLAETGLPIYVSEYDVDIADDQKQREVLSKQFELFWTHKAVKGITLWGYIQGQTWKPNTYLLKSNGIKRPALEWLEQYLSGDGLAYCKPVLTGINDIAKANIEIYPNPVNNGRLSISVPRGITSIDIIDLNGKIVKTVLPNGNPTVETNLDAPAGVYVVRMIGGKEAVHSKIVVQ